MTTNVTKTNYQERQPLSPDPKKRQLDMYDALLDNRRVMSREQITATFSEYNPDEQEKLVVKTLVGQSPLWTIVYRWAGKYFSEADMRGQETAEAIGHARAAIGNGSGPRREGLFLPWLFVVCKNLWLRDIKKDNKARGDTRPSSGFLSSLSPDELVDTLALLNDVLDEEERAVVERVLDGESFPEIGDALYGENGPYVLSYSRGQKGREELARTIYTQAEEKLEKKIRGTAESGSTDKGQEPKDMTSSAAFERVEAQEAAPSLLSILTEEEQEVIIMRLQGYTRRAIGEELYAPGKKYEKKEKVSETQRTNHVNNVETRAIEKMKKEFNGEGGDQ